MKAKEINIEMMNMNEQKMEEVTYYNIQVPTAINKAVKSYPKCIITKVETNYFN